MVRCETCILGCCDPQIPFYIIEILRTPAPGAAHFILQYPVSAYKIWNNGWILIFKVSKQPYWSVQHDRIIWKWRHFMPVGQKWNTKIITLLWIKSWPVDDRLWCLGCLNECIEVPNMIGSFESGATASIVAKNWTENLSQPFEELQGSNSKF